MIINDRRLLYLQLLLNKEFNIIFNFTILLLIYLLINTNFFNERLKIKFLYYYHHYL